MSTYNFNGPVSGQNNFGDHNQNLLVGNLDELVARVREEQPDRVAEAELIRAEVARAAAEDRPVDGGRIQGCLATLREGADAGSGVLALITSLGALLGL
ncbi:hypothetical protein ACI2LV_03110 [Streptomyces fungicidicus]|uniref:hypothetical protein n=1 Tax=Streptomyces fungicidicus TaxID=68203 RepID=UPI00385138CB